MSNPDIVLEPSRAVGIRVTATGAISHLCPFKPEADFGKVTISWVTGALTIELHSLAGHLSTYADRRISHEELVGELRAMLERKPGIEGVTVSATFNTGGLSVIVATENNPQRFHP